jgi:hypothetical protein
MHALTHFFVVSHVIIVQPFKWSSMKIMLLSRAYFRRLTTLVLSFVSVSLSQLYSSEVPSVFFLIIITCSCYATFQRRILIMESNIDRHFCKSAILPRDSSVSHSCERTKFNIGFYSSSILQTLITGVSEFLGYSVSSPDTLRDVHCTLDTGKWKSNMRWLRSYFLSFTSGLMAGNLWTKRRELRLASPRYPNHQRSQISFSSSDNHFYSFSASLSMKR